MKIGGFMSLKKNLITFIILMFIMILIGCVPIDTINPDPEYFTVTFETFDGTSIESIEVENGMKITISIQNPTKTGFIFDGWFKDSQYIESFNFETDVITAVTTLYAKWDEITVNPVIFTVTFDSNGGSQVATQRIDQGDKVTKPEDPNKVDHEFVGWFTDLLLTEIFNFDSIIENNLTLYAKWEPIIIVENYFEVTFFPNKDLPQKISVLENSKLTEPNSSSETHVIVGFYKDLQMTLPWNFDSDIITSNLTIYVKWVEKEPEVMTHVVSFDTQGGNEIEPLVVDDQSKITPPDTPIKDGFIFIGWYLGDTLFDFNTKITTDITLKAHFMADQEPTDTLTSGVYFESMWATFEDSNPILSKAYYRQSISEVWLEVDQELIRPTSQVGLSRVDVVGLKAGFYDLRVIHSSGDISAVYGLEVMPHDRSGYAHFNFTEGIGGYLDDGSLKPDAYVVYVTEQNKNDITIPGIDQVGLGWILNNNQYNQSMGNQVSKINFPLVFRFIGTVTVPEGATAYNSTLNGGSIGDNGNMLRIKDAKHITIEGIGEDAIIDGWGIHFMAATSGRGIGFEARNLTFINYPEDALGLEGVQSGSTLTIPVQRGWLHNLTFYPGFSANPAESDKANGDGSADFKRGQYLTLSYSQFIGAHKTNLVGSSDSSLQFHITMHHNLWQNNASRIPLARQANIHMYNNVFETTDDNQNEASYAQNTRADAYIFSEANYFYGTKNPSRVDDGAIKSFGDIKYSTYETDQAVKVDDRATLVPSGNMFEYFDTNEEIFYYDSVNQVSDVMHLTDAITARAEVAVYAGTFKQYQAPDINNHKITNIAPTVITDDISVPDTKINKGVPLAVFKVDANALVTLTAGAASYKPVLVSIYGEVFVYGSGSVLLEPGIYVIESEQAHGASKGTSQAKESRASYTIELDSEAASLARIQNYYDAIDALPLEIEYNNHHRLLIEAARLAYESLSQNEKLEVDESRLLNAEQMYISNGVNELKDLINDLDIPNLTEDDSDMIYSLYQDYLLFVGFDPLFFTESEVNLINDAWAFYQSVNAPEVTHNFETDQYVSSFFTIASNSFNNTKYGSATYEGIEYTVGYKMDSKGLVTFTIVGGTTYQVNGPTIITHVFYVSGQHSITKGSGEVGIFYMEVKGV